VSNISEKGKKFLFPQKELEGGSSISISSSSSSSSAASELLLRRLSLQRIFAQKML
jgi:predicted solute-binding protein